MTTSSGEGRVNFSDVPARKLSESCRRLVSNALNVTIVTTVGNIHRDYRGLAQLMGIGPEVLNGLEGDNPTEELLNVWAADSSKTIENLIEMLQMMARFDVVEELLERLMSTAGGYNRQQLKQEVIIIKREDWGGTPLGTENLAYLKLPAHLVIIHHTRFSSAGKSAMEIVDEIHKWSMDIAGDPEQLEYNFVVTSDGTILELTGWSISSFHHSRFDFMSVQIALTGDYDKEIPPACMLESLRHLLEFGVAEEKLSYNYKLSGFCDTDPSSSPGKNVMDIIKHWPNYRPPDNILNSQMDGHELAISFDF